MPKRFLAVIVCFFLASCIHERASQQNDLTVNSPDGALSLKLLHDESHLNYEITSHFATVIEPSQFVFTIDGDNIAESSAITRINRYSANTTYPTRGVHSLAINHFNGARFTLHHQNRDYVLDVRAFNDAIAFRFVAPGNAGEQRTPDELTTFTLPIDSTIWSHDLSGHYEGTYNQRELAAVKDGQWAAPPLTIKLPHRDGYASITEANLFDYAGMALQANDHHGYTIGLGHRQPVSHPYELRYSKQDIERLSHPATITGTITTPWRVVLIGKTLNTLVNSDAITNLCPPPDKKLFPQGIATDWVKPGRAVWRYLDGGITTPPPTTRSSPSRASTTSRTSTPSRATTRPGIGPDEAEAFSDAAGKLGFEYNVLEDFWSRWTPQQLRSVCDYSHNRGVGIWIWKHSKDLRSEDQRQALWKICRDAGVVGVKVDFFDHEAKEVVDLYETLLREAAENHLLLDFHGADKPTGTSRTYPNELTREAIRGMEASRLTARAMHDTILPFTRLLAGPADYTPMLFSARRGDTTWAHQIATPIIMTSPLLTFAANPKTILSNPARDFIASIPATWDETIVLPPSDIGEIAIFARRSGGTWFLAAANGPEPRHVEIPLSFLSSGNHPALLIREEPLNPAAIRVQHAIMRNIDKFMLDLPGGGGFAGRFSP
jgi:alpha-glucosidase